MKKVAKMLRRHKPLLMNWFKAKGQFSSGIVEGFNNKAKLTTRKAYGFRTFYEAIKLNIQTGEVDVYMPNDTHWGVAGHLIAVKQIKEYFLKNRILIK